MWSRTARNVHPAVDRRVCAERARCIPPFTHPLQSSSLYVCLSPTTLFPCCCSATATLTAAATTTAKQSTLLRLLFHPTTTQ
uniref:Uncharacterized protein n=1 Tax=Ditylenchus dipsaci TaxID=166011 RepID=A0A915CY17_9BILA